jgi:phosphoglycerol transferase
MADTRMTTYRDLGRRVIVLSAVVLLPLVAAVGLLDLRHVNLSIPFIYNGGDDIWQLVLTKMLLDTGWVLKNPFLGAPSVAEWHNNAAAQTSALHSVLMWCIGRIVHNPVLTQQIYYVANFSVISLTSFIACRLLKVSTLLSICVGLAYAFSIDGRYASPHAIRRLQHFV